MRSSRVDILPSVAAYEFQLLGIRHAPVFIGGVRPLATHHRMMRRNALAIYGGDREYQVVREPISFHGNPHGI